MHRVDIESGGLVEAGLGGLEPGLLQSLEGGQILFSLTGEAAFLNAEIDELALVARKTLASINIFRVFSF